MTQRVLVAFALVLCMAGCSSPKADIKRACIVDGGVKMSSSVVASRAQIEQSCECFSTQLAAAMPEEQLKVVAEAMREQRSEQVMSGPVMMAAKSCAVS